MQSLGVQGSLARGPDNFKFEIWRVGLIEEESVGDGGREHMFNASHSHLIRAFQVTMPFHKRARGQDCQR